MSTVHEYIQKTLANDETASQAFRDYVREKARSIIHAQSEPVAPPVQPQPEPPTE